jgi:DNA polymerase I
MKKSAKSKATKTLVLVDAHAILHRAYHALPPFVAPNGQPSGALFGLASMLMSMITDLKPDHVAACFDLPEPTFRHDAFTDYKAGRAKTDDDLISQIVASRRVFEAFGIPMYEAPGFEADDLLGTIVEQLKDDESVRIILVTGDMDTLQLVRDLQVSVYTQKRGAETAVYDENAVRERFGVGPEFVPDWKGLSGDPSDNIPGVPGIGAKTATEILKIAGTIESLYEKLAADESTILAAGIKPRIVGLLKEHEQQARFSKVLATIRRDAPIEFNLESAAWSVDGLATRVTPLFEELAFRTLLSRIKSVAEKAQTGSVPSVSESSNPAMVEPVIHDADAALRAGILYWIIDADRTDPSPEEVLRATGTTTMPEAEAKLRAEITGTSLEKVWTEIEEPLIPIIARMQSRGIAIDRKHFETLETELSTDVKILEQKIYAAAGEEFNINSPRQMSKILFENLKLPHKGTKKAGGAYSTRADILEDLVDAHPIVRDLLSYRELTKLLSTYITVLPGLADTNNRIHARFIQAGTTTGRFSSAQPNMQNIPTRDGVGKRIRAGFVAASGYVFVGADYSQIELRIAAILSGDEALIETFRKGNDIHAVVASRVFGVPQSDITSDMRRKAKVINFGILYGMGARALQQSLQSTREEAAAYIEKYMAEFPKLADYMKDTVEQAAKLGYTETVFGRRRPFRLLRSPLPHIRAQAERMAINAPIQGAEADVIKLGMRFAEEDLAAAGLTGAAFPLLQVHDELIYEVREEDAERVSAILKRAMETSWERSFIGAAPLVPLLVETSSGRTWGDIS